MPLASEFGWFWDKVLKNCKCKQLSLQQRDFPLPARRTSRHVTKFSTARAFSYKIFGLELHWKHMSFSTIGCRCFLTLITPPNSSPQQNVDVMGQRNGRAQPHRTLNRVPLHTFSPVHNRDNHICPPKHKLDSSSVAMSCLGTRGNWFYVSSPLWVSALIPDTHACPPAPAIFAKVPPLFSKRGAPAFAHAGYMAAWRN